MWKCDTCGEEHEDQFSSCWKCARDEEVVRHPSIFSRIHKLNLTGGTLDDQLAEAFVCSKCSSHGAFVKRIAATGAGLSGVFEIQGNTYISLSCCACGFVEFYDADILDRKWDANSP